MAKNSKKNKYGLRRDIPDPIKRQIRQACGFGCVLCGDAIVQYDHIDPEFHEAKIHDPACMALLCGACHDKKTRGLISIQTVKTARINPVCISGPEAGRYMLDVSDSKFTVCIHGLKFVNIENTVLLNGCHVLKVCPPESLKGPPLITAKFFDDQGRKIGQIKDNEWSGSREALDIRWQGTSLEARNQANTLALRIILRPPNELVVEHLDLFFNGCWLIVDNKGIRTHNEVGGTFLIDSNVVDSIENLENGIVVHPGEIQLGVGKQLEIKGALKTTEVGLVGKGKIRVRTIIQSDIDSGPSPFAVGDVVQEISLPDQNGQLLPPLILGNFKLRKSR